MKKKLLATLIILFSISCLSASERRGETCKLSIGAALRSVVGTPFRQTIMLYRTVRGVMSWEECYDLAIKRANNLDYSTTYRTQNDITTYFNFVYWKYNDSYIPFTDSSGKVNSQTSKFIEYQDTGDMRVDPFGNILFEWI